MVNAKDELLKELYYGKDEIVAADISCKGNRYILYRHHTDEELKHFFNSLNFKYDEGYGGQSLYGNIWCKNTVWYERGEYDGSEWWKRFQYDETDMPKTLNRERAAKLKKILK